MSLEPWRSPQGGKGRPELPWEWHAKYAGADISGRDSEPRRAQIISLSTSRGARVMMSLFASVDDVQHIMLTFYLEFLRTGICSRQATLAARDSQHMRAERLVVLAFCIARMAER